MKADDDALWDRLEDLALDEAADDIEAMAPGDRARALLDAGIDASALAAKADDLGKRGSPTNVVPLAPRRRTRFYVAMALVAAAAAVTMIVVNRDPRAHEPIANDPIPPSPSVPSARPDPLERAASLRMAAADSCAAKAYDACGRDLDEAARLDPAGDRAPDVVALRTAIAKAHSSDERKGR